MKPPRKRWIYVIGVITLAYMGGSAYYFAAGRPLFGWLWAAASGMWVYALVMSVKNYRREVRQYAFLQSLGVVAPSRYIKILDEDQS